MTDAENTPTAPMPPAAAPAPDAQPPYAPPPAEQPPAQPHAKPGHFLPGEGVALIVVGALLFGAFAFSIGWFGGRMSSRVEGRRAFMMQRGYSHGYGQGGFGVPRGHGYAMQPGQVPQGGQADPYGYGNGMRGRGGMRFAPNGSNIATPPAL